MEASGGYSASFNWEGRETQGLRILISGSSPAEYDNLCNVISHCCPNASLIPSIGLNEAGWAVDYRGVDLLIVRLAANEGGDSLPILEKYKNPIFVLVDQFSENLVTDLINCGVNRVISVDEFERMLPACLEHFFPAQIHQSSVRSRVMDSHGKYDASDPIHNLLLLLQKGIGSHRFFDSILNTFSAIVVVLDKDGRIIFFNRRAEAITGYSHQEVIGRKFQDLFLLPEELDDVMKAFNRMTEGDYPYQHQNSWLTRSGEIRRIEWANTILDGEEGENFYVLGIGLDITEDYRYRQALKESQERFSRIFRSNPVGMAILEFPTGVVLDINESLLNLVELKREAVIGCGPEWLGFSYDQDLQFKSLLADLQFRPGYHVERNLLTASQTLIHVHITVDLFEMGGDPCILLMVQDLSEQHAAEERIRRFTEELERSVLERTAALEAVNRELQAEIGFRKAVEFSSARLIQIIWETPDIVAICDLMGRVQYLNRAGRLMFGVNEVDSVSHLSIFTAYTEDYKRKIREEITPYVEQNGVWYGEAELILPDASVIPVSQVVIAHRDIYGEIQFFSSIARDITDQRKAAEDLKRNYEKEKELSHVRSDFFSMTSHEFRTPLSTIFSSAELLEHYGNQWSLEKRLGHLRRIQDSTQRMTQMLDDILELSKIEMTQSVIQIESIDLVSFCKKSLHDLAMVDNNQHHLNFHSLEADHQIHTARAVLESIFQNLLTNAVKYSSVGTDIDLSLKFDEKQAIVIIQDQGIGIVDAELDQVLLPFHRGSNVVTTPGSGLGLTIVAKSLEKIGGTIKIQSAMGEGTRVTVVIPDLANSTGTPV
jgi:PAS domain S-box-containing protein